MKNKLRQEKGITMMALVVTIIILLILTSVLVFNTQDSVYIKRLNNLYSDIELLRSKTDEYYNEYGQIPAKIKYTNIGTLKNVLSTKNDTGDFYVIDLEAMEGITLNYGKDYENVKSDSANANNYTDLYIINENSHNIFFVRGIEVKEKDIVKTYYTDYTEPDETTVDIRYVDGILIPDGYYYIGKTKDSSGNETIVISNNKEENVNLNQTNQFTWEKQISQITEVPSSVTLENNQEDYQFISSVNNFKGYFKNTEGKVRYVVVNEEQWSEAYTKDTEYKDKNGDTVTIPEGFKISMADTMNTVKKGLVVKDENDNEWVWIEVPEDVFTTANNDTDYEKIKADLIEYAKDYRKGSNNQDYNWDDEWYDGCGLTKDEYENNYKAMLSSVYNNMGFWISRYEIGDETATNNNYSARTDTSGTKGKTVSKRSMIPYNWVTCEEAQNLASKMSPNSNQTSSLLFGIQWDLTCKFLEENSELTYANIATDSTNWGNYSNSSIKLTKGKYNTSKFSDNEWLEIIPSVKTSTMLLTTGASEETRKMNIYDFAGNEWEWTLEYAKSDVNYPCNDRGGYRNSFGYSAPASHRLNRTKTLKDHSIAFRIALY